MTRLAALVLAATLLFQETGLQAQVPSLPAAAAPTNAAPVIDPLGRETPQSAVQRFLETCHARDYVKASRYLDLRRMPSADGTKAGADIAKQLEDLLDDLPFDIAALSHQPEGDQAEDLPENYEHLTKFKVQGKTLDLQLERVELKPGLRVWLLSAGSVYLIPLAHQLVQETPFERELPRFLVDHEIFDTAIWKWLALLVLSVAIWAATGALSWGGSRAADRIVKGADGLRRPIWICLTAAGIRFAMDWASPATLVRLYLERFLGLAFLLGVAAIGTAVVDLVLARWQARLDPRVQAVSFSVLPLGKQVLKLTLYLAAFLTVISWWGYNTSTILAGLGVGGLAVALAAQKTIENLFGGISVIGDRPVLVGDTCRFGNQVGTIMRIGLRSTRIRTPDRTIISIPNAQFSAMALENISGRDKYLFHPTLNLRRDTTAEQMTEVVAAVKQLLTSHPNIEAGAIPVRFVGVGTYSLDVEIGAYITSAGDDAFLTLQQELLLKILAIVQKAGTGLAVPLQEEVGRPQRQPERTV
jgi:MscS family membrane protein